MSKDDKRNDVRKTIRFDKDIYNYLDSFARSVGVSFSTFVKLLIDVSLNDNNGKKLQARISDSDRELLNRINTILLRSSNNLNQATHALNSIKGVSFLHVNPNNLMDELFQIKEELYVTNFNFNCYHKTLDRFVRHARKRVK